MDNYITCNRKISNFGGAFCLLNGNLGDSPTSEVKRGKIFFLGTRKILHQAACQCGNTTDIYLQKW